MCKMTVVTPATTQLCTRYSEGREGKNSYLGCTGAQIKVSEGGGEPWESVLGNVTEMAGPAGC